jgi:hypothetical protein
MMLVLLIAGTGLLLAGLLTVGAGIQMDLSFGNTLILSGTVAACTGVIMLSLWAVARELKKIAWQRGPAVSQEKAAGTRGSSSFPANQAQENGDFSFSRDLPDLEDVQPEPPAPRSKLRREEAPVRDRRMRPPEPEPEPEAEPEPEEAAPPVKQRRNLMFSSTSSRKERERAQGLTADPAADQAPPPPPSARELPPPSFEDAWPRPERLRMADPPPAPRRAGRAASTFGEANGAAGANRYNPSARNEDQSPTVLKSGTVDGMAYTLYSDGSIEAEMPEGLMRFASIDELRAHLDQRS